jgi:hypothetical protein
LLAALRDATRYDEFVVCSADANVRPLMTQAAPDMIGER